MIQTYHEFGDVPENLVASILVLLVGLGLLIWFVIKQQRPKK